jgi:hypothetical protein
MMLSCRASVSGAGCPACVPRPGPRRAKHKHGRHDWQAGLVAGAGLGLPFPVRRTEEPRKKSCRLALPGARPSVFISEVAGRTAHVGADSAARSELRAARGSTGLSCVWWRHSRGRQCRCLCFALVSVPASPLLRAYIGCPCSLVTDVEHVQCQQLLLSTVHVGSDRFTLIHRAQGMLGCIFGATPSARFQLWKSVADLANSPSKQRPFLSVAATTVAWRAVEVNQTPPR